MAWKHPNVYIGSDAHSPKYWPEVRPLHQHLRTGKVLFATDFPVLDFERTAPRNRGDGSQARVERKFLRDNALRLYKLG